ncbi:unnamed protein product, partial [Mesorhabditis belari]|uniref:PHD-type domain-containing protein n=1 Tax=Mesorhabditis belari TaxID=2138241 RepID=A0AAF3E9S6_9BILA
MASYKQLFSPLTCHSLTYRSAEFLLVDFDKKGEIPSLKFPMNSLEPQVIRITNNHPTEAMCLQVFPPLPRDAWDKPFGHHIWSTITNEWFLEIDGWQFDSRLSEYPRNRCKIYKLKPGVTKEMKIYGRHVQQGNYGLKLYGWIKGMRIADQVMVACQKYGRPLGAGKKPITASDCHAMDFAAFCELQASIDDVALQIDAGVVVPVMPIKQYIFDVLDKLLEAPQDDDVASSFLRSSTIVSSSSSSTASITSDASFDASLQSSTLHEELNETISSITSPVSTTSLSLCGYGLIDSTAMVQNTPAKSTIAAVNCQKRRHGDLFRDSFNDITEDQFISDADQPGPSNKRIYQNEDNSNEDYMLIDFIDTSTPQARAHEIGLNEENQDNQKEKNDENDCPKCYKTMSGKGCLQCQDGCRKWWHTKCFDSTLHHLAGPAKARGRDGKFLCAACREGLSRQDDDEENQNVARPSKRNKGH